MNNKYKPKILVIGETIIDKFDNSEEIGGAPLNFASHFVLNGGIAYLMSAIGEDVDGKKIRKFCNSIGVYTNSLTVNNYHTGICYVTNEKGQPNYNLLKPCAYDFLSDVGISKIKYDVIYFGTLIQRSNHNKDIIRQILSKYEHGIIFCDINLRKDCFDYDSCELCFKKANIIKISNDEIQLLKEFNLFEYSDNEKQLLNNIQRKYSNIQQILFTKGEQGSTIFSNNTFLYYEAPNVTVSSLVGAGDSYSASYLYSYLTSNKTNDIKRIEEAGRFATLISAKTVQKKEAIPLSIYK